jgi:hypothetical protein
MRVPFGQARTSSTARRPAWTQQSSSCTSTPPQWRLRTSCLTASISCVAPFSSRGKSRCVVSITFPLRAVRAELFCRGASPCFVEGLAPAHVMRRFCPGQKSSFIDYALLRRGGLWSQNLTPRGNFSQTDETKTELVGVISGYLHKVPEHKTKAVWKEMLATPAGLSLCSDAFFHE